MIFYGTSIGGRERNLRASFVDVILDTTHAAHPGLEALEFFRQQAYRAGGGLFV